MATTRKKKASGGAGTSKPGKKAPGKRSSKTTALPRTYSTVVRHLLDRTNYERLRVVKYDEKTFKLDRMRKLLKKLGNPQDDIRCIHIAGTVGKGSTCSMISNMLQHCGYTVGAFTSPHLIEVTERIAINNEQIGQAAFTSLMREVIQAADQADRNATYFELLTAAALKHFADQAVDMAVMEVGLGGRLDSTNVITPELSVITKIDLDHMHILGSTIESIAAEKAGIDPAALFGSGPRGRILERDVQRAVAEKTTPTPPTTPSPAPPSDPGMVARDPEEIPVRGIRKVVARRMHESLASTAQLTLSRTAEVTSLLAFRVKMKAKAKTLGIPAFTVNDLVSYFALRTLRQHPDLNAHFLGDRIVRYSGVNLGVAVDTDRGLLVPVVRSADEMSLPELSREIRLKAEQCRDGSIRPGDMAGGTITLTNLGALGIESFTPVLNPPEVAILGLGGIHLQPARKNGKIEHVDVIHLNLTINHQAVDGAPGARYLKDLGDALAEPELAMLM